MKASNSAANRNKLKDKLMIIIALIAVSVILLSAFLIAQEIRPAATPVVEPIQSASGYYLSYGGNASKIFVVSTNASYGPYPGPTRTGLEGGSPVVKNG